MSFRVISAGLYCNYRIVSYSATIYFPPVWENAPLLKKRQHLSGGGQGGGAEGGGGYCAERAVAYVIPVAAPLLRRNPRQQQQQQQLQQLQLQQCRHARGVMGPRKRRRAGTLRTVPPNPKLQAVLIGLDGAGKTTILYKLQQGRVVQAIPTVGFNVEEVKCRPASGRGGTRAFELWDVSGASPSLWRHYYQGMQAAIFVVDAADRARFPEARRALRATLTCSCSAGLMSLLVFANKQDLPGAASAAEVSEALGLGQLGLAVHVAETQAVSRTGDGLRLGLGWLCSE